MLRENEVRLREKHEQLQEHATFSKNESNDKEKKCRSKINEIDLKLLSLELKLGTKQVNRAVEEKKKGKSKWKEKRDLRLERLQKGNDRGKIEESRFEAKIKKTTS